MYRHRDQRMLFTLWLAVLACFAMSVQAVTLRQLHDHAVALRREDPQKLEWVIDMMWREHMGTFNPNEISTRNPTGIFLKMGMTHSHSLQNLVRLLHSTLESATY